MAKSKKNASENGPVNSLLPFNLVEAHKNAKAYKAYEAARMSRLNLLQRLADPFEQRDYYLTGPITFDAASALIGTMDQWHRIDGANPSGSRRYRVILNSSGGAIIPALAVYDFLRMMKLRGCEITVHVNGHASYHAAIIAQAASPGRRLAGPRSYMFIGQLKSDFSANTLDAEHRLRWINGLQQQYNRLVVQHSDKLGVSDLKKKTQVSAWCLKARDAVKFGLLDGIAEPGDVRRQPCVVDLPFLASTDSAEDRIKKAELVSFQADSWIHYLDAVKKETDDEAACIHRLFKRVDTDSCTAANMALHRFMTRCGSHMSLLICSPGGTIVDGNGVFDTIKLAQRAGHAVDTIGFGYMASMGGVLLQAGTTRAAGEESWVLVHRASGWFEGTTEEVNADMKRLKRQQNECFEILASRTKGKLRVSDVRKRCDRGDWWLPARKALEVGLLDKVF